MAKSSAFKAAGIKRAGLVVCKRIGGRVQTGDCVFHLATDYAG